MIDVAGQLGVVGGLGRQRGRGGGRAGGARRAGPVGQKGAVIGLGRLRQVRARYLEAPYRSAGVSLRLVELTGRPGDIVFMDPRCLHTVSANASDRPRLTMRMTCSRA